MVTDINSTYCGDHFAIYKNTESGYMPETNICHFSQIFKKIGLIFRNGWAGSRLLTVRSITQTTTKMRTSKVQENELHSNAPPPKKKLFFRIWE